MPQTARTATVAVKALFNHFSHVGDGFRSGLFADWLSAVTVARATVLSTLPTLCCEDPGTPKAGAWPPHASLHAIWPSCHVALVFRSLTAKIRANQRRSPVPNRSRAHISWCQ